MGLVVGLLWLRRGSGFGWTERLSTRLKLQKLGEHLSTLRRTLQTDLGQRYVLGSRIALSAPTAGLPLPTERGKLFAASGGCTVCHANILDAAGSDVSLDSSWRSTLMADSTRAPYW